MFILPTLVLFTIFIIVPMFNAFQLSLFKWNLLGPKIFVGLKNYITLFQNERFWNSYVVTLHFTFISILCIIFLSFWFSLALTSRLIKYKNVFQSLIFIPVILVMVAIAVVWKFMFQTTGLLSIIFFNIFGLNIPWLTSGVVTPYAVIMVYVWRYTGFYMVMFIAGLLDIPEMYYEAATIDGAGFWGQLVYITIPQLKNTLILVFVSCVIFSFGSFALQFVMTEGGPTRSTEIIALLIYKEAFHFTKFGYSSAISVVYFITLLIFSVVQLKIFKSGTT